MSNTVTKHWPSLLPADDNHPYRTGAWTPNVREHTALDLRIDGELPSDVRGVYLRNTENPLLPSIGRYHPFDGDGMLHALHLTGDGAEYRNRMIPTDGLAAELDAGEPLWAGLMESPAKSQRDGWGARTRLKDASSTDVIVHNGQALTSFYQCGDLYACDPVTLAPAGKVDWVDELPHPWGVSAHTKVDPRTGELLFFSYSKQAPYMMAGSVSANGQLEAVHDVELPGARLPHDMAFTDRFLVLNDFPLYWDPKALAADAHAVRFYKDQPSRFALVDRRTGAAQWFDAKPTFVLHFTNAFEEGDEVILDGFYQADPAPRITPDPDNPLSLFRMLDTHVLGAVPYRWRFNTVTGAVSEGPLSDTVSEFGMINPNVQGRPYRYVWAMTTKPDWFLFSGLMRLDVETGDVQRYDFPDGVYASESPMAPRAGANREDDGLVLTLTTDMNRNASEALAFDAADISAGPIARIELPERVCAGTHSTFHSTA